MVKNLKSINKPSLFFKYESSHWDWQSLEFNRKIPNEHFVFHNKDFSHTFSLLSFVAEACKRIITPPVPKSVSKNLNFQKVCTKKSKGVYNRE